MTKTSIIPYQLSHHYPPVTRWVGKARAKGVVKSMPPTFRRTRRYDEREKARERGREDSQREQRFEGVSKKKS